MKRQDIPMSELVVGDVLCGGAVVRSIVLGEDGMYTFATDRTDYGGAKWRPHKKIAIVPREEVARQKYEAEQALKAVTPVFTPAVMDVNTAVFRAARYICANGRKLVTETELAKHLGSDGDAGNARFWLIGAGLMGRKQHWLTVLDWAGMRCVAGQTDYNTGVHDPLLQEQEYQAARRLLGNDEKNWAPDGILQGEHLHDDRIRPEPKAEECLSDAAKALLKAKLDAIDVDDESHLEGEYGESLRKLRGE